MKHRLGAAAAVSALVCSASMLVASPVNTTLDVQSWNDSTKVATGETFLFVWVSEAVRHVPTTQHGFISNPFEVSPGPCRVIALEWDGAIIFHRPASTFEKLIASSATHGCRLAIGTVTSANSDGSFDLVSASPTK